MLNNPILKIFAFVMFVNVMAWGQASEKPRPDGTMKWERFQV